MSDKGLRYNTGKPKIGYVLEAKHAIAGASKVLEYGAGKYFRSNWRNGLAHTGIADCLCRHLVAYLSGEDLDSETGLPHADHVLVNALFLSELIRTHPQLDDRPARSPETGAFVDSARLTAAAQTETVFGEQNPISLSKNKSVWVSPKEGTRLVMVHRGDGSVVVSTVEAQP